MKLVRRTVAALLAVFLLPSMATAAWWAVSERPSSWRTADWSASGVLPAPLPDAAAIHILAARTGGLKGAFAVHSWIVVKRPGQSGYDRYDKVGWGTPVRRNRYPADGRWYSNDPEIVASLEGAPAAQLIPAVESAVADYPYVRSGDYRIWPGPNSNSFVAHVLRAVPELGPCCRRMQSAATSRRAGRHCRSRPTDGTSTRHLPVWLGLPPAPAAASSFTFSDWSRVSTSPGRP